MLHHVQLLYVLHTVCASPGRVDVFACPGLCQAAVVAGVRVCRDGKSESQGSKI